MVFSLVPARGHVGNVRINAIASFATKLCVPVGNAPLEPITNGSLCHAQTPSNLFRRESLFLEFNELLRAIRSLRMAGKVSTPCKRVWVLRLAWKRWCLFRLFLFLQFLGGSVLRLQCLTDLI